MVLEVVVGRPKEALRVEREPAHEERDAHQNCEKKHESRQQINNFQQD